MNNIEALLERLGFLKITKEASSEDELTDTEMSTAPAVTNKNAQAEMPRSMVPDPGWFDSNQTKFED